MKTETIGLTCAYSENLLAVKPNVEAGVPVDAIGVACDRAMAVLHLLSDQFIHVDADARLSNSIIYNALTDVQSTIETIRTLVDFAHQSTRTWQPSASTTTSKVTEVEHG